MSVTRAANRVPHAVRVESRRFDYAPVPFQNVVSMRNRPSGDRRERSPSFIVNPRFRGGTGAGLRGHASSTIPVGWRLARRLLWKRERKENENMNRTHALAIALATVLMTTAANAAPPDRDEVQAPRGQEEIQAPRGQEVQAPRGQEVQAPRGQEEIQAPRSQEPGEALRR